MSAEPYPSSWLPVDIASALAAEVVHWGLGRGTQSCGAVSIWSTSIRTVVTCEPCKAIISQESTDVTPPM